MTTLALSGAGGERLAGFKTLLRSRWLWCLAAVLFMIARDHSAPPTFLDWLGDTDDATRLVQVREFLAGAGWYDLLQPRFGGASPLVSHWSRLIDLPLALLISAGSLFTSQVNAEAMARLVWPALLALVFFRLLVHEAEKRGGETAAWVVLIFAVTCLSGLFQFRSGRIDHHSVMIIGTVIGVLMLARSFEKPDLAWPAGALLGCALVIGYEPLALIVPLAAIAALVAVLYVPFLPVIRMVASSMFVVLTIGLGLSLPPNFWFVSSCDALSVNLVFLVAMGASGLWAIEAMGRNWSWSGRLGALIVFGALAATFYVAANPVCLGGPYAQVGAEAKRVWLSSVVETRSFLLMYDINPTPIVVFGLFATAGLVAAWMRYRARPSLESGATLLIMAFMIPPALWQMKFLPYASFMAAVCIGLMVAELKGGGQVTPLSAKLIGILGLNQASMALAAGVLLLAVGTPKSVVEGKALVDAEVCRYSKAIAPLAKLERGLVVAHVDLGPFIVALTPHDAYAAPYHRIDTAIATTHRIFTEPPAVAQKLLASVNADYVVACIPPAKPGEKPQLAEDTPRGSLEGRLTFGETVPFLQEIAGASPEKAIRVWRVVRP